MVNFKNKLLLFMLIFVSYSCKKEGNLIVHPKINLPKKIYDTKEFCWEVYPISNLNSNDTIHYNSVSKFVLNKYSKIKVSNVAEYKISFYQYDSDLDNGINEKNDYNKEIIEWKGEFLRIEYIWKSGVFLGVTYFDNNGNIIKSYVPVKLFEDKMKVIHRNSESKNGFNW